MDTNKIKSFAKEARLLLMDGVLQRLNYWGFKADGTLDQNLQSTTGGYIFRGQVFTDASVPKKWDKLKKRISNKQDVLDVVEEAAYTWFNRLMAIKILEVNGYISPVLEFTRDIRTPALVQNAKRGQYNLTKNSAKDLLIEYLQEDKEEKAFGLLVTELCNTNDLLYNVFGKIDDYTEILIPQNLLQKNSILDLINNGSITEKDFKEVELIGWLYQFYISDRKDEVFAGFKKNKKARAEDIPAATQIFTPKWIVRYMVENTVGKIFLDYEPNSSIKAELKYLVENESENEATPIISDIKELTLLDPACGSGHILVVGFELLFKMYREEGYTAKQAVENILKYNIFGLDIDDRAVQLARFAVLIKAAQYDSDILNGNILPNIFSFPEASLLNSFKEEYYSKEQTDWYQLLGMKLKKQVSLNWVEIEIDKKTKKEKEVKKSLTIPNGVILNLAIVDALQLHCNEPILVDYSAGLDTFWSKDEKGFPFSEFFYAILLLQQGKNLGSTVKLKLSAEALNHIKNQYTNWGKRANNFQLDAFEKSFWDNLKPYLEVLFILSKKYTSVVTNPPYMGQKSMNADLKDYMNICYPVSKSDLFAVFMEVCLNMNIKNGFMGMINQHAWMFLSSYENLRKKLINDYGIVSMLHLGPRTFEELSGEVVQSTAFILLKGHYIKNGTYYRLVDYRNILEKERMFLSSNNCYPYIPQANYSKIPSNPIAYWASKKVIDAFVNNLPLYENFESGGRCKTHKDTQYVRKFWELNKKEIENRNWKLYNKGGANVKWYGNLDNIINWKADAREFYATHGGLSNSKYWNRMGITWNGIGSNNTYYRIKIKDSEYASASPTIIVDEKAERNRLLGFLNSKPSHNLMKLINPTIQVNVGDALKLPDSIGNNDSIIELVDSNIKIAKYDWDSNETSWEFQKSPLLYGNISLKKDFESWQRNVTDDFFLIHSNEEELNKIFITIYGLEDELSSEVALKEITFLHDKLDINTLEALESVFRERGQEAIELPIYKYDVLSQFISYCFGIFLGRYRLDRPGLNIAHHNPTEEETSIYQYKGHTIEIDEDGILPIMGENCAFPDDALVRAKDLILAIWGEETLTDNINFLHECLGMDLHKWLTEKFWNYHTSMYSKKPIYWLFSSNSIKPQNAAFKVLVYMHRMDKYTVQKIQRHYLHPHQEYIKREIEKLMENEGKLSRQEQKRLERLQNWEIECRDYNEVLKELANQQIEFDLDDGVDVNYAKFEGAVAVI